MRRKSLTAREYARLVTLLAKAADDAWWCWGNTGLSHTDVGCVRAALGTVRRLKNTLTGSN